MSGFDVLAWVWRQPDLRRIAVAASSTSDGETETEHAHSLGAASFGMAQLGRSINHTFLLRAFEGGARKTGAVGLDFEWNGSPLDKRRQAHTIAEGAVFVFDGDML